MGDGPASRGSSGVHTAWARTPTVTSQPLTKIGFVGAPFQPHSLRGTLDQKVPNEFIGQISRCGERLKRKKREFKHESTGGWKRGTEHQLKGGAPGAGLLASWEEERSPPPWRHARRCRGPEDRPSHILQALPAQGMSQQLQTEMHCAAPSPHYGRD